MSAGCKHGHIANSCTACYEEALLRRSQEQTQKAVSERDRLTRLLAERTDKLTTLLEAADAFTTHLDDECMECEYFRAAVKKARERL